MAPSPSAGTQTSYPPSQPSAQYPNTQPTPSPGYQGPPGGYGHPPQSSHTQTYPPNPQQGGYPPQGYGPPQGGYGPPGGRDTACTHQTRLDNLNFTNPNYPRMSKRVIIIQLGLQTLSWIY
uniref:Uncharacterized protein n=1 Tax=Cacopsylla melanoneura TaxID=428564 RepID=A0A8D8TBY1_9HEMI